MTAPSLARAWPGGALAGGQAGRHLDLLKTAGEH
jgi:hypothetical protein